jgi:hypothetical protein
MSEANQRDTPQQTGQQPWRGMSHQDFALWGLQDVAYVKRVDIEDSISWAIHSADGTQIGSAGERDLAFAAIRQNDLEPLSLH